MYEVTFNEVNTQVLWKTTNETLLFDKKSQTVFEAKKSVAIKNHLNEVLSKSNFMF